MRLYRRSSRAAYVAFAWRGSASTCACVNGPGRCDRLLTPEAKSATRVRSLMWPERPALATTRRASECARHPSNVVLVYDPKTVPLPTGADARNTCRLSPNAPMTGCSSSRDDAADGTVSTFTTPPAAFPHTDDAFDRMTSTASAVPRSRKSKDVRPFGSVSGMPSVSTRMPREVPAFDRSPAPRAPNPRIKIRMSLVPYRDWARTPGTRDRASSSPKPLTPRSAGAVTFDTASGVFRISASARFAVMVMAGRAATESRRGWVWPATAMRGTLPAIAARTLGWNRRARRMITTSWGVGWWEPRPRCYLLRASES